ncbi:hypothetical protein [Marinobacter sp.]|nr:hypothetical protein [Marinobacter sp.]HKK54887.1 hypothetical protein [Marinobacter sp.]
MQYRSLIHDLSLRLEIGETESLLVNRSEAYGWRERYQQRLQQAQSGRD